MLKKLIRCGHCEKRGIKKNLGLVMGAGTVSVRRGKDWKKYEQNRHLYGALGTIDENFDSTIITGDNFTIFCGFCKEPAYTRKEEYGTVRNIRVIGVSRVTAYGSAGTIGA